MALKLSANTKSVADALYNELVTDFSPEALESMDAATRRVIEWVGKTRVANKKDPHSLRNQFYRVAMEFEEDHKGRPPKPMEILTDLKRKLKPDGKIEFNKVARPLPGYRDIFENFYPHILVSEDSLFQHDCTSGNFSKLKEWLQDPDNRHLPTLQDKLVGFAKNNQKNAAIKILRIMRSMLPPEAFQRNLDYVRVETYFNAVPFFLDKKERAFKEARLLQDHLRLPSFESALDLRNLPLVLSAKFQPATYIQIRDFLSYEIKDVPDLNRAAAMMTLLFPDYKNFVSYIKKIVPKNLNGQNLNLGKLIDTSEFNFEDKDYQAWGQALLQQPDDVFFYFKSSNVLKDLSKDKQGRILIGKVRDELYDHIDHCLKICTETDLSRCSLPLVQELNDIKNHQARFSHLQDKCSGMPELIIEGDSFGRPGWKLERISYNDPRLYLLGRYTGGNCERINGMWFETIRHAIETRKSTFYVVKDEKDQWMAHSWVYPEDIGSIKFAGFESDKRDKKMDESFYERLKDAIRSNYPTIDYQFGKPSRHLNTVPDFLSEDWHAENRDDHKKEVTERILDIDETIKNAGIAPTIRDDGGLLKNSGFIVPKFP